jgi:hypothetical protein
MEPSYTELQRLEMTSIRTLVCLFVEKSTPHVAYVGRRVEREAYQEIALRCCAAPSSVPGSIRFVAKVVTSYQFPSSITNVWTKALLLALSSRSR